AADADLAAIRPEQRGEDPNRRGLASPVRPEHPEYPALPGRQVYPVQRGRLAEPLDQPGSLNRIRCRVISHVSIVVHTAVRTRTRICQPPGAAVRPRSAPCPALCQHLAGHSFPKPDSGHIGTISITVQVPRASRNVM